MLADVPAWIIDVGIIAGIVTAFITMTKAVTGWGPVHWLVSRLVTEPVHNAVVQVVDDRITDPLSAVQSSIDAHRGELREHRIYVATELEAVRRELTTNGGASVKDAVTEMRQEVAAMAVEVGKIQQHMQDQSDQ